MSKLDCDETSKSVNMQKNLSRSVAAAISCTVAGKSIELVFINITINIQLIL